MATLRNAKEMIKRSGPDDSSADFIDAQHIGGCDDLYALDRAWWT
ncbi:Glutaredoxin-3 [Leclercia adecarboxylata]|uniref:Glutaredoxin-3 n=1 Tax=Leclercia adecarboxylata TaxID=83655 RepID=A0A4U9HEI7_9ENTR|nr:Glutaredoxin-3 [Leclercia adecarboxylata]